MQNLADEMLTHFGEDPLAAYDTSISLLESNRVVCEVALDERLILVSDSFIRLLEFSAAQASLVNIVERLRKHLEEDDEDPHRILVGINRSAEAIHAMYTSRLLMHMMGEFQAPSLTDLLPREYQVFVRAQTAIAATFSFLHEQAHIEIAEKRLSINDATRVLNSFVDEQPSRDQAEEHCCDVWAIRNIAEYGRARFVRTACFFFFNQWVLDYLLHDTANPHPPAFNRIQFLVQVVGELREDDFAFFSLMTHGLNGQSKLRHALNEHEPSKRKDRLLRFCRAAASYQHYEDIVDALSRSFEQIVLGQ